MTTDTKTEIRETEETLLRKTLEELTTKRTSMEQEADAIVLELTTPTSEEVPPMGLDTPLVDPDGYPRGDIDIYRARTLRGRFRVLRNDHKEITDRIETLLIQLAALKNPNKIKEEEEELKKREAPKPKPKYDPVTGKWGVMNWDGTVAGIPGGSGRKFDDMQTQVSALTDGDESLASSVRTADQEPRPTFPTTIEEDVGEAPKNPFCRVNAVAAESPAESAGLQEDDLIVEFGPLHTRNHNHLKAIAQLVPEAAGNGESIALKILRRKASEADTTDEWKSMELQLAPKPWGGRGLLGCHIVPYTTPPSRS